MYEDVFQQQLHLRSLILVGNPLVFIAANAFSGPESLQHLNLAVSTIRSLTDIPTANLIFLETLDLAGNNIFSLDGLDNFNLQQLTRLVLDFNHFQKIRAADVAGFREASRLELSFRGNDLVDVEPYAFNGLDIGSLDFTGCFNKMNTSVLLKGLEGVKSNKLKVGIFEDSLRCSVTSAGLQSFCNISVVDLDFQMQHFHDLTEISFQCLTGLQKLDLTRAHLSSLPSKLPGLSALSHLVLDQNSFLDVCHIQAANLPMLTHLSISGSHTTLLFKDSCLEPLSHLEELDLSHSTLDTGPSCCNKQLSGLSELKLLNLSYNAAMQWEPLPFKAAPQLNHLDCSHVMYSPASVSPFTNLQNLHTLNLSWSGSDLSNVDLLKGLKNLRALSLKGNTMKGGLLPKAESFSHVPLLESLVLSGCGITGMSENVFKGVTKLMNVDLSDNHLVTLSISAFYSLKQIQLSFARNAIVTVDVKNGLENLGEGSSIDLSYNPLVCNCTNYQFINWVKGNADKMKHLQETVCDATHQKITGLDLQCTAGSLVITLTVLFFIAVIIAVFYYVRKFKVAIYSSM